MIPIGLEAGTYSFIVATDRPVLPPGIYTNSNNLVFESNETNNEKAASPATIFTSGATPKLAVSSVQVVSPATAGAQLSVSWTVTNNGVATGIVPIDDYVYLSYDQVLNSTDRYLGYVTTNGGLAAGASYTQNAQIQLPGGLAGTFYVFIVTDGDQSIFESDTTAGTNYDSTPVQIQLPPPADLVAGTVTIPGNAVPGQNITITYQVTNNGSNAANGSWYDSLYLAPTPTFSVKDPLIGTVYQQQDLAADGGSYTGTLTAALPAVNAGSYYVIVRTNVLDNFPELTLSNNLSASLTQASVDAPALTLGTPTTGTLGTGQYAYYKVIVTAGQTLQVTFTSQSADSENQMYMSFGAMPTLAQYQFSASQELLSKEQITIPATQSGTYYLFDYGAAVGTSPENYTITAAVIPFAIQAVSPSQVGQARPRLRSMAPSSTAIRLSSCWGPAARWSTIRRSSFRTAARHS